ncbi:DUF2207 domain-containing protein [Candidatus Roizmanbacteria bacterium]|nr:MAG: DUF2207 domain-containing protein [Candidatus Roizmanbacteria bacterium]
MRNIYTFFTLAVLLLLLPLYTLAQTTGEDATSPAVEMQYSGEYISSYTSTIQVQKDGQISVNEEILYDFGTDERHGIFRKIPTDKTNEEGKVYRMDIEDISVDDENGTAYPFETLREGDMLVLKIGDPDKTITGRHTYVIRYTVAGALTYFTESDELYWEAIGSDSNVPIAQATAVVKLPEEISEEQIQYTCFVGSAASTATDRCTVAVSGYQLMYSSEHLVPYEGLTVVARFPMGVVSVLEPKEVVSFWDTLIGKITLFGIIVAALLWYIVYPLWLPIKWWMHGRDPKHQGIGETSAWFSAPKLPNGRELTPAEAGAIVDEKIQLQEFTALAVQLAQKGYLKIVEKKKNDFELHKTKDFVGDKSLLKYEKLFLTEVFSDGSELRLKDKDTDLAKTVSSVEKEMYKQLIADKIFPKDPDNIRKYYAIITGLATFTFNILLVISAGIFGRIMPRKTLEGVHAANIAKSLKNFLTSQERQLEFQADRQMMFEKLLPYAISFGVEKIWAERFKDLTLSQPAWYQGQTTGAFTAQSFSNSLHSSFASSMRAATTSTTSSSGFSSGFSGGSVGGGGGGGSVGSW